MSKATGEEGRALRKARSEERVEKKREAPRFGCFPWTPSSHPSLHGSRAPGTSGPGLSVVGWRMLWGLLKLLGEMACRVAPSSDPCTHHVAAATPPGPPSTRTFQARTIWNQPGNHHLLELHCHISKWKLITLNTRPRICFSFGRGSYSGSTVTNAYSKASGRR